MGKKTKRQVIRETATHFLSGPELDEFNKRILVGEIFAYASKLVEGNTAQFNCKGSFFGAGAKGKDLAYQLKTLARLIAEGQNQYMATLLLDKGLPDGQKVNINVKTGEIIRLDG